MSSDSSSTSLHLDVDSPLLATPLERYRPCAAMVVLNSDDLVLIARRTGMRGPTAWQFPQGGIDNGESPRSACLRELGEEVGLDNQDVEIIDWAKRWLKYLYPPEFAKDKARLHDLGQIQAWFMLRVQEKAQPSLDRTQSAEFDRLRWSKPATAVANIVPFKKLVYRRALTDFAANHLARSKKWGTLRHPQTAPAVTRKPSTTS